MLIHDAIYFLIPKSIEAIKWSNDNLIDAMSWQELPELQHDEVKLSAEMEIYYKSWASPITLENYISNSEITKTLKQGIKKYNSKD